MEVAVLTNTMTALHGLAKATVDTREFRNIFFQAVPAFDLAFFSTVKIITSWFLELYSFTIFPRVLPTILFGRYVDYMAENCKKSCNKCDGGNNSGGCSDKNNDCATWSGKGYCGHT